MRLVIALLYSLISLNSSLAAEVEQFRITKEDQYLANSMRRETTDLVKQQIWDKYQELLNLENIKQLTGSSSNKTELIDIHAPLTRLRIFVSTSMSHELLKAYYQQARKYGGSLVFNGLPQGSFKELTKLVLSMGTEDEVGAMEIDDESFKKFNVTNVPTIILSQEHNSALQEDCQVIYDSINGSIGIKPALEIFAKNGDLAEEAQRLLHK